MDQNKLGRFLSVNSSAYGVGQDTVESDVEGNSISHLPMADADDHLQLLHPRGC